MSYEIVRRYSCIGKTFETLTALWLVCFDFTDSEKKKLVGGKKRFFIFPASGNLFILVQLLFALGYI